MNMTSTVPIAEPSRARPLGLINLILILGTITTLLDSTIVNIALDQLRIVFDASVADTQWIVAGYLLAYVAVIPVSGWASERFGARRVWMFAVGVFLLGSLLCGVAWSLPSLIGFRVLQGIGGGMVLPVSITLLSRVAGKDRMGGSIALIGFVGQLAPILGPIIGGSIIASIGWNWLFFVNIPICFAALILGRLFLPASPRDRTKHLDVLGLVLLTPGVVGIAYGISKAAGSGGFGAPDVWIPLAIGVALVAAFVLHSLRARRPALLDVRVFARRSFGLSSVITFVGGFSLYALMFLIPLFYQQVRGESVLATGFLLIPQGLGTMCFILLYRRFAGRVDTRLIVGGGVVLMMLGVLPFATVGATGGDALLLIGQFFQGFGMGAASMPIMVLALTNLSLEETPRGSAAFNVVQRVGAPFGVTVIAVLLQSFLLGATTPQQAVGAFGATFWWVIALSAIPLILAALLPRPAIARPDRK